MRRLSVIFIGFIIVFVVVTACLADVYDVTDYGATGNGSTLDTDAINATIEAADSNGGGTVYFPPGTYKSGSIRIKDNITLNLDANAIILATDTNDFDMWDYNPWEEYQGFGHCHWKCGLIWAIERNNIAITGSGLINGSAMTAGVPDPYYADRAISFKSCNGVTIDGISIYRGGTAGIRVTACNDVDINNVTIDTNRDGMNIDCCNDVNITNCIINSPKDDAICLKSTYALGYKKPTENVNISNCTVMGHAVGYLLDPPGSDDGYNCGSIKFGTESNGGFKNITITDCNFELSRGFMLATVDGGDIENINIDNIQMTDIVDPPIFLRLGNRARGPGPPPPGTYRNVNISNVTAETNHKTSCIISGIPDHCIEDVNLTNINIIYNGGGSAADGSIVLGENESSYPYGGMFGSVTPSYGFYVRHAKGVEFHDCDFSFDNSDSRPAFVLIDVNGFELDNVDAERYYTSGDHIKFDDVDDANIHDCADFPSTTAGYAGMEPSEYKITVGQPFTVTVSATAASTTGISTTDMLMDSNYLDTEYSWLNAGTPKDVEFFDIQLYNLGEHCLEIGVCDINIGICPVGDFDLSGNVDFEDYNVMNDNWLEQNGTLALPNDPVAWWKFEEGSGSTANDSSVNSNTGTLYYMDSSDWVTGYDGGALDFDGSDDYIKVPDSPSISIGASDYTICAWIYPHTIPNRMGIITKTEGNYNKEYAFYVTDNNELALEVELTGNNGIATTDDAIVTTNEWQHVMVTFDASTTTPLFYYNFEEVPGGTIAALPTALNNDLYIGMWGQDYYNGNFDGVIDDVRIYDYQLQPPPRPPADLNEDNIVDFKDHAVFADNWLAGEVLDI